MIDERPFTDPAETEHDAAIMRDMLGRMRAFARGWINLHQILAVKAHADGSHELPWTRDDIYL